MEDLASEAQCFFEAAHNQPAVNPALAELITAAVKELT
jgi:hypothetical protein